MVHSDPNALLPPPARRVLVRQSLRTQAIAILLMLTTGFSLITGVSEGSAGPVPVFLITFALLCLGLVVSMRQDHRRYERAYTAFAVDTALTQERLGIARQLHDIISDGLALIHLRASVAQQLKDPDGAAALQALHDIEVASRQTIAELRKLLLVLRSSLREADHIGEPLRAGEDCKEGSGEGCGQGSGDLVAGGWEPGNPIGHDSRLDELIAQARQASLTIETTPPIWGPEVDGLPASMRDQLVNGLREGLTNIARYAGPTRVQASLVHREAHIVLRLSDDGPVSDWTPVQGSGLGLGFLEQDCQALGGTLTTTLHPEGGGFTLTLTLPLSGRQGVSAAGTPPSTGPNKG